MLISIKMKEKITEKMTIPEDIEFNLEGMFRLRRESSNYSELPLTLWAKYLLDFDPNRHHIVASRNGNWKAREVRVKPITPKYLCFITSGLFIWVF